MTLPFARDVETIGETGDTDAALVAGVRAGEAQAFRTIVNQHANMLVRYAVACLDSRDDADDVVQAVFVRLWRAHAEWRVTSSIRAYLVSAVRHEALNRQRSRRSSERVAAAVRRDLDVRLDALGATSADEAIANRADLATGLRTLSARRREAVVLRYGFGMSAAQAARIMGRTPKAVEQLAVRGLTALRDWFSRR